MSIEKRLGPLAAVFALTLLMLGAMPRTVLADCTQLSSWPSFTRTAQSSNRIVIGTVQWTPGGPANNRFMLRVDEVLRGSAPASIEFDNFRSGAPQPICPEDSFLRVGPSGDRLALAYGAHLPGESGRITSVAFVAPSDPNRFLMPKMEQLTEDEVRALAALPETATAPAVRPESSWLPVASLAALVALAFLRRRASLALRRQNSSGLRP